MTHTGRIECHRPRAANDPLNRMAATWRAAHRAACKHDGIAEDAKFAVFTETNPFAKFVDIAGREYFAMVREYQAGGYIGLTIGNGRAT